MFVVWQFTKESGNKVEEVKLRVTYIAPPQPPSPVPEESEEGSPSRVSESENGDSLGGGFTRVSYHDCWTYAIHLSFFAKRRIYMFLKSLQALREHIEPQENSLEVCYFSN